MEQANWFILPISALIPLILGVIWYHPKVLGTKLTQITGKETTLFGGERSIGKITLIYLFSLLLSYILSVNSIHQISIFQLFLMEPSLADPSSEFSTFMSDFFSKYNDRHRSFGHGFIHGAEASLFYGLAFFGITALMGGKLLKQIWIHLGFWVICCAIIAGINCAFF